MRIPDILIPDLMSKVEGLAPHSYSMTKKALSCVEGLDRMKKIADIGCGVGYQSLILSGETNANILAIDHRVEYIQNLGDELATLNSNTSIYPIYSPLDHLPCKDGELDLIWSESLVIDLGLDSALGSWSKLLKDDGYIIFHSYCQNSSTIEDEVSIFFRENNIEIASISDRIEMLDKHGFRSISHLVMPDECWWNYFCPILDATYLEDAYEGNAEVEKYLRGIKQEVDIFEAYGETYSCVCFVAKKCN